MQQELEHEQVAIKHRTECLGCICTYIIMPFLHQAERARFEEHFTSQVHQKDAEIQQQMAELQPTRTQLQEKGVQIHQREAELRTQLNSTQLSLEVLTL